MRFSLLSAFACAVASQSLAAQAPGTTQTDALHRALHDTTLANGLNVIAVENHAVPLVTVAVVVKTGAFTQQPGDEGVPHLFEHMLFKSYVGDQGQTFGQEGGRLQASYNGATSEEDVNYYVVLPSEHLNDAVAMLAQLVRDPVFTSDNLNAERFVVLDEFHRDESNPLYLLDRVVNQRLWTTAWGRKNPLGEIASIQLATPKRLNTIFHQYYVPNNAALVVSGDITAAQVFAAARQHFGRWTRGADPFATSPIAAIPALAKSTGIILEGDVHDVVLQMKWEGPSVTDNRADTYAADVLSTIVDTPGSQFQQRLVDNGLFTSCTISYGSLAHVGPIVLQARTTLDSLPHALNALAFELGTLDTPQAFSDEELEDARQSRTVSSALELDEGLHIAHSIGFSWSIAGLDYFLDYTDQLRTVKRDAITRYVHTYIMGKPASVGVLVPSRKGEALRPAISSFLASEGATLP